MIELGLKSIDKYWKANMGGDVYLIESPVTCERNLKSFMQAMNGDRIKIDGKEFKPLGLECKMPGSPIAIGETIGILTQSSHKERSND